MKKNIIIILLIVLNFSAFSQVNYYVDGQIGNNSNNGLSSSSAFNTIQFAINQATHGDTIFVLPGVYSNTTFGTIDVWKEERTMEVADKLSANSQYLTIKPLTSGTVTLKGDGFCIIQIKNSSYIKIEGFNIQGESLNIPLSFALQYQFTYKDSNGTILERVPAGSTPAEIETLTLPVLNNIKRPTYFNTSGIQVNGSHHIDLLNNTVINMPGEGIRAFTSDFLNIIGNTVSNCSSKSATGVHGLSVYNMNSSIDASNISNPNVRIFIAKNKVHNNINEVYSWSEQKTFIVPHIDEGKGITVQRCTNDYNWLNGKIRIENNISYNNGFSGIHVNSGDRVEIVNNTCFENNQTTLISGGGEQHGISIQEGTDIKVSNNIVQANATLGVVIKVSANSSNVIITDNIFFGTIHSSAIPVSTNTQNVNPNFTNSNIFDFSLLSSSTALNAGNTSYAPLTDFFGNTRNIPDIGAIEYQAPLNINGFEKKLLNLYPNPTNGEIKFVNSNEIEIAEIFNIFGQLTKTFNLISGENRLDISNISDGIYFVKIGVNTDKIIKKSH